MTTVSDNLAEAIAECQSRVDADLRGLRKPGMEPQALFEAYTAYGEDPWIIGPASGKTSFASACQKSSTHAGSPASIGRNT